MNTPLLCLYDVSLYKEDLTYLEPYQWLNDQLVSFFLHDINYNKTPINSSNNYCNDNIITIDAAAGSWLRFCDDNDERQSFASGIGLTETNYNNSHILMPINNISHSNHGGSHWSLLYIFPKYNKVYHYDSSNGLNNIIAENSTKEIATILQLWNTNISLQLIEQVKDIHISCQQQSNSYDCGIYTILYAKKIINHIINNNNNNGIESIEWTGFNTEINSFRIEQINYLQTLIKK